MKEYIKNIYFIEETQNIEGSYIEVKTLFVNEDKTKALDIYKKLASKKTNSFGVSFPPIFIEKCRSSTINRLLRHMPK